MIGVSEGKEKTPDETGGSLTRRDSALTLAAFLPYVALLAAAYSLFCVTNDDPFITYRYAVNILAGHGPVFNVGERVEGFSSPLHLLLCVLLLKVAPATDILFKAKLAGLAFAALAIWQTGRLARAAGLSDSEAVIAQLLVGLNTNFALAAVNGLETSLYACLTLAAILAFLRELRDRAGVLSAGALFCALLARPETFLMFGLLLIVRVVAAVQQKRAALDVLGWAALFLIPAVGVTFARLAYYGQPEPNTYYAKQVSLSLGLHDGWLYLLHPLFPVSLIWSSLHSAAALWAQKWPLLSLFVFWGLAAIGLIRLRREWVGGILLAAVATFAAFVLRFGGDWMAGWRFLIPIVPLLAILQCHGLRALRRPGRMPMAVAPAIALLLWVVCAFTVPHDPWANVSFSTHSEDLLAADSALGRKWVKVNRYIQDHVLPGGVVAYSEMGFAGYNNLNTTFIDVRGLTDREIAQMPMRYKGPWGVDDDYWFYPGDPLGDILTRRLPMVIISFSPTPWPPAFPLGHYYRTDVVSDPRDPYSQIVPAVVFWRLPVNVAPDGSHIQN